VPVDVDEHPAADDPVLGVAVDAQQRRALDELLGVGAVVEAVVSAFRVGLAGGAGAALLVGGGVAIGYAAHVAADACTPRGA
jgi:hypothetical protein